MPIAPAMGQVTPTDIFVRIGCVRPLLRWGIPMLLLAAAGAQAADPLAVRQERPRIPVSVKIEIPSSLDTLRFGFGVGGAGALFEPSHDGLDVVVRSAERPTPESPGPMDRLGLFLDRSPFNFGDSGPSQAGLQLELLSPGDIGASIRYRW